MKSMTGYGKFIYSGDGYELSVEIKAVNNRFLDINCKYPKGFSALEEVVRNLVKEKLSRGRIDVYINFSDNRESGRELAIDTALACEYKNAARKIAQATDTDINQLSLSDILRYPDVIKSCDDLDKSFLKDALFTCVTNALSELEQMRSREGEKLKDDMLKRMSVIENAVALLVAAAPQVISAYRIKLKERITEFLKETPVDEARLLNEVAIFSDRVNIDEELTRLSSHISQFRKICSEQNSGKKLDFLVQEFNREANTVCSKANDVKITDLGLKIKYEIEKIREQVQNIE